MKFLLTTLLISLLFACSTVTSHTQVTIPTWYLTPTHNSTTDSGYLYGVGYGPNLGLAKADALTDLSQQIIVEISSSFEINRQESSVDNNAIFAESSRQNIKTSLQDIVIPSYDIIRSEQAGAFIYTSIRVDKSGMIEYYAQKLTDAKNDILLLEENSGSSLIKKKSASFRINQIMDQNYKNILILNTLDSNNAVALSIKEAFAKMKKSDEQANANLRIYLDYDNDTPAIANVIGQALTAENLTLTLEKGIGINDARVSMSEESTQNKIYNMYLLKTEVTLKTYTGNNNLIATSNIKVSGSSNVSYRNAKHILARNLGKRIEKEGIYKILNLKN